MGIDDFLEAGIDKELVGRMLIVESLAPPAVEFITLSVIKTTEQ
jgi:hypothetical protein